MTERSDRNHSRNNSQDLLSSSCSRPSSQKQQHSKDNKRTERTSLHLPPPSEEEEEKKLVGEDFRGHLALIRTTYLFQNRESRINRSNNRGNTQARKSNARKGGERRLVREPKTTRVLHVFHTSRRSCVHIPLTYISHSVFEISIPGSLGQGVRGVTFWGAKSDKASNTFCVLPSSPN